MIYYKVLSRITTNNTTIYYLKTNHFKFNKHYKIIDLFGENWQVYIDVDSLYPISKSQKFNEALFTYLTYLEVESLFMLVQQHIASNSNAVIDVLANTLMYWDDYN